MNKYKRLLIFTIMCLSLILMFIYKYKYSKLSTLFELMHSIPASISGSNKKLIDLKESLRIDFQKRELIKGVPYWTEIFPGIFVYSTYWLSNMTRTLCFAENLHLKDLEGIQCEPLHENIHNHIDSVANIVNIQTKEDKIFFYIDCKLVFNTDILPPPSLKITFRNFTSIVMVPKADKQFHTGQYVMCVEPLTPAFFNVYKLLEFIIHHSYVGIKFFVFYENGLTYEAKKFLIDIAFRDGIYVIVKPWNLPLYSQNEFDTNEVAFLDCFHHVMAENQSKILFKTNISQFILPKNNNIKHLIEDFGIQTKAFKFHEKIFCLEYKNDDIALNLNMPFITLLKFNALVQTNVTDTIAFDVFKLKDHLLSYASFQRKLENKLIQETELVPKTKILLHSYKKCRAESKLNAKEDKTMWAYKNAFFKSHIYLLAKKYQVIID